MNKIITILIIALTGIAAHASMRPDTVMHVGQVDSVMIITEGLNTRIALRGIKALSPVSDFNYSIQLPPQKVQPFTGTASTLQLPLGGSDDVLTGKRTSRWNMTMGGVALGLVKAHGLPAQMEKSLEISVFHLVGFSYSPSNYTSLSIGLGLNWRNFRMTGSGPCWTVDDRDNAVIGTYPDDVTPANSRLKTFALTLPLMVKQRMPFRLAGTRQWVAAGAEMMFTTHASVQTQWTDLEGQHHRWKQSGIPHRTFTCNLVAMLGFGGDFGLYVRYSPMHVLASPSPQFSTLSTGIVLFY